MILVALLKVEFCLFPNLFEAGKRMIKLSRGGGGGWGGVAVKDA